MTNDEALRFLADHRCIPEDASQEIIDRLDVVRHHLIKHPDPCSIPLILGVFGDHMGWGIFQLFDDALRPFTPMQLAPHLRAALMSDNRGVRWWAAHWAMEWPHVDLLDALFNVLESKEDEDAHYFCLSALGSIHQDSGNVRALSYLRARHQQESDPQRKELLDELLQGKNA